MDTSQVYSAVRYTLIVFKSFNILIVALVASIFIGLFACKKNRTSKKSKISDIYKDNEKILRYLEKCIIESRHNEDLIPKCKYLIKKYPQIVNISRRKDKFTPFQIACYCGSEDLVNFMIEMGADIFANSSKESNPLYLATQAVIRNRLTSYGLLRSLCVAGASLNQPGSEGATPLMLAATYGCDALVKWMLTHGADPMWKGEKDYPWKMALRNGHESTAALLFIKNEDRNTI